jgi:hypothetical protein
MRRKLTARTTYCVAVAVLTPGVVLGAVSPPKIHSLPAAAGNYTVRSSRNISMIVVHKAQGLNAAGWFANPKAAASSHYDVHHDGKVFRSVADKNVAWHAGNWSVNERSIGIEQSGFVTKADTTDAQYRSFARLVASLSVKYKIPLDRKHIIGHSEVPDPFQKGKFGGAGNHTDPGKHWNWTKFMNLVRQFRNGSTPPKPTPPKPNPPKPNPPKPPAPALAAALEKVSGALTIKPGQTHVITVAFRNTGTRTWMPAKTELAENVKPRTAFKAPVDAPTKTTETGLFRFNIHVPKGVTPQDVTKNMAIFDSGNLVKSGVVGLKIKIVK